MLFISYSKVIGLQQFNFSHLQLLYCTVLILPTIAATTTMAALLVQGS